MKKTILLFLLLFSASFLSAQEIADVRNENHRLVVYNAQGEKIASMSDAFDKKVVAISATFFVVQDELHIETYDAQCKQLGSMMAYDKTVLSAAVSTFSVKEFKRMVIYDSKCNRVSSLTVSASAEIAEVRMENNYFVVYNAEGTKLSSLYAFDKKIVGTKGTFFVVQDDTFIQTYDAKCNRIGSMVASEKIVTGAAGSTFTVEENGWITTYDSKCNRISTRYKQ